MELRQIVTFREVARSLSFTRAAERLHYAQSSVTAQVQALEKELGVILFERLGRRVLLTDAGRRMLEYSERFVRLTEETRAAVVGGEEPRGTLTVGAPETLLTYRLPAALRLFRERYPCVDLVFGPGVCSELSRGVDEGALDVALVMEEPPARAGLLCETLLVEPLSVVGPPDHQLAGAEGVGPEDLEGEALMVTEARCGYRVAFELVLAGAGSGPSRMPEFSSVEAIKQCDGRAWLEHPPPGGRGEGGRRGQDVYARLERANPCGDHVPGTAQG